MPNTTSIKSEKYGYIFLVQSEDHGYWCWRTPQQQRVSRYFNSEADALYFSPK